MIFFIRSIIINKYGNNEKYKKNGLLGMRTMFLAVKIHKYGFFLQVISKIMFFKAILLKKKGFQILMH